MCKKNIRNIVRKEWKKRMSLPEKTINQIAQTTDIAADDILIVEKSSGTKTIKYSDLMNGVLYKI